MSKQTLRYSGGLSLLMLLPSSREITVHPGDEIQVMTHDAKALLARPDFEEVRDSDVTP